MPLSKLIFNCLFACRHRHLGRMITLQCQTYQVCLDCGARIRYSWQTMSSIDEREPLLRLLAQRFIQATREKIAQAMLR
ncbi:MAG TPA: hypothetical protein VF730_17440 [Terracidiphilus sp.]